MGPLLAIILLTAAKTGLSQPSPAWHKASESLTVPTSNAHTYASVNTLQKNDTVSCIYTLSGSSTLQKGFKAVYIQHGFFTDNAKTLNVFFDSNGHRIYNVEKYYFN